MADGVDLEQVGQLARDYLAPGRRAFWRWSADGSAVENAAGATIAVAAEITAMLQHLADGGRGLPRFDEIVAMLAVERGRWLDSLTDHASDCLLRSLRGRPASMRAAIEHALPPVVPASRARAIAQAIAIVPSVLAVAPRLDLEAPAPAAVLAAIRRGLAGFDHDRLERIARTGIDGSLEPADVDLPPPVRTQRLIAAMRDDARLRDVGAMATEFMAATALPRRPSVPADLRLGGNCGVTNRGTLDRLTLTELAYDDDVLAARIALNEI